MPTRPARPCRKPGCAALVRDATGFCAEHLRARRAETDANRPSAADRGYDSSWRAIRLAHLRLEPTCRMAGDGFCAGTLHVDHIKPLSRGGTNDHANLRTLCQRHHNARTAREQAFGRGAA